MRGLFFCSAGFRNGVEERLLGFGGVARARGKIVRRGGVAGREGKVVRRVDGVAGDRGTERPSLDGESPSVLSDAGFSFVGVNE